MDNQQLSPVTPVANASAPQPTTFSPQTITPALQTPQPVPVYPTPTVGAAAPAASPIAFTTTSSATKNDLFGSASSRHGSLGLVSLGLGAAAVGVLPLLIFVPSLVKSVSLLAVWLVVITLFSIGGVLTGVKSHNATDETSNPALIGMMVSLVMLVLCIVLGSYYIKVQLTLNAYKNKYNSLNNNSL